MAERTVRKPAAKNKTASPKRSQKPRKSNAAKVGATANTGSEEEVFGQTQQRILTVATEEFSTKGYEGARIDEIMRRSKVSKNLIYHYFGSKEKLFVTVLEAAYRRMHQSQLDWKRDASSPVEAVRQLVRLIFNHWRSSPEFIGLLTSENLHRGRHIKEANMIRVGYGTVMQNLRVILEEGEKTGVFRKGVDPVDFYISISSLAYHLFSNRYTLSLLLGREYDLEHHLNERLAHIEDMVLSYLLYRASADIQT
jgi:TetR/AcrR family transcriptional regulator